MPQPSSPTIATVTTCMGRLGYLKLTAPYLYGQPDEQIVVDYSCPEKSGDWVEATYPNIKVVRVPGRSFFNSSKAKNIGAATVKSDWICFIDSDIIVAPGIIKVLKSYLKPGIFIRALGGNSLCGFVVCPRESWELIQFNEKMEGWGCEDLDFIDGLVVAAKLKEITFNDYGYLGHIDHPDTLRTKYHKEKDRGESMRSNDTKRRWRK